MSWTQTLQLAQTLTKAIQANAKREATATPEPQIQESPMGDDALTPPDPQAQDTTADSSAPAPEADPAAPAARPAQAVRRTDHGLQPHLPHLRPQCLART